MGVCVCVSACEWCVLGVMWGFSGGGGGWGGGWGGGGVFGDGGGGESKQIQAPGRELSELWYNPLRDTTTEK